MDFHNNIFAGPPSQLFSQGRAVSCSETTTSSPNPSLAAVTVGIADLWNPLGACDRCASCQGKPKFLFSRSEFSHRQLPFKSGVCSQSRDRKSLPLAHFWWLWEKPVVSTSSRSSTGSGPGRSSPCPCPRLHLTPRDPTHILSGKPCWDTPAPNAHKMLLASARLKGTQVSLKSTQGCVGCGCRGDSQSWSMPWPMHTASQG